MKNLKISLKLFISFVIIVFFVVILAILGIISSFTVNGNYKNLLEGAVIRKDTVRDVEARFLMMRIRIANIIMDTGDDEIINNTLLPSFLTAYDNLLIHLDDFSANNEKDSHQSSEFMNTNRENAADLRNMVIQFRNDADNIIRTAVAGDPYEARMYFREIIPAMGAIGTFIEDMRKYSYDYMDIIAGDTQRFTNALGLLIGGIAVLCIIVVIFWGRYILALISKPLTKATISLNNVGSNIESTVNQFSESASSLAESSSQQAASIEETSATMNETSAMIAQNAENTREATKLASQSKQSADSGKEKIQEMVRAMSQLRESSGAISKIIKTIEDIAFQTNLLAINATIEAARAGGDAGRSFSVVAGEVRSLAQKSANATAETTEIIEKNISLTRIGSKISEDVAEALGKITDQFDNLNKIINEINAASEEQAAGVRQINTALLSMESATQANSAISEESAASVNMLKELVSDLGRVYADIDLVVEGKKK